MSTQLTELSRSKCHGGHIIKYQHTSPLLGCDMKFSVFVPASAENRKFPAVYFLSGLTCNEDNFITKACAVKPAARLGIVLICPDTSPRGLNIEGENDSWDFGSAAGFYVDATELKWKNYQMYSYVTKELPQLVSANLPVDPARVSIFGHSMGGHGALVCALRNPGAYKSVSAFAPISNPVNCPWGVKAFTGYLGSVEAGKRYDGSELLKGYSGPKLDILVDQGSADAFLKEQLKPEALVKAAEGKEGSISLTVRMQDGYDHSYWFIQTFVEEHLEFH
ncbi:hypothetical protein HK102_009539, partial [Quaeritorhiza haematococci]